MTKTPNYVFDDELYHHGITGQRWGYRRFQNEDGSWTPEGRERYGEGGAKAKSDLQKYKARVSYNTRKYKENLKSKARMDDDTRKAKEERHRVKEWAKTERTANKEQAKTDRRGTGFKFGKSRNLSNEELSKAIDRLKLQAEYNKQYVLATQPNSALVKADRFFEGPTGKVVSQIAINTLPDITKTLVSKALEKDKKLSDLEIREKESTIHKNLAEANQKEAMAESTRLNLYGEKYDYKLKNEDIGNLSFKDRAKIQEERDKRLHLIATNKKRR